ncbi:MAG: sugar phosphate isomerase/epimerase [Verrucomicrobia bacterium]|nr:sugar phosphate isomerase/epimerase [Verrucomicrobiota bacterium]
MKSISSSRRRFLKTSSLATAFALARNPFPLAFAREKVSGADLVRLGVASYSLRKLPRADAIAAVNALGTPYVNIKSIHLPYELPADQLTAGRREFEAAGLTIVGGGTVSLQKDTDEDIRRYFEYARTSGMPLMVIAPTTQTLPRIEKFVKQYDIRVAIHNHGPEDKHFPGPRDILPLIRNMDPRVGLCVDIGHTARTGVDVVQALADTGDRLLDMHVKDLRDLSDKSSQCIVGQGAMPMADIFRQLIRMNYTGFANLEYEIHANDPLPGMKESFSYMRGVLDALKA